MRRLLTFACAGETLAGSLDAASGFTGLLLVTGGGQTRVGSHRMYERLAAALAASGTPCFRFDRRGVGESSGDDPGFRGSGPDIAAAVAAFRAEQPQIERVIGFGLCDGASALALEGEAAGLNGMILVNPWFVEAASGAPPPAAIKAHYRKRLSSLSGWRDLLGGSISYRKLLKGVLRMMKPPRQDLAEDIARALGRQKGRIGLILAKEDATAVAAEAVWRSAPFRAARDRGGPVIHLATNSHTFAHPGDAQLLLAATLASLKSLGHTS